jgi:hypothetical protein
VTSWVGKPSSEGRQPSITWSCASIDTGGRIERSRSRTGPSGAWRSSWSCGRPFGFGRWLATASVPPAGEGRRVPPVPIMSGPARGRPPQAAARRPAMSS